MNRRPFFVLGLGRARCGDEGLGARVIDALENTVTEDVELARADLFEADDVSTIRDRRKVILIAPREDGADPPGTMWFLTFPGNRRPRRAERKRCDEALWVRVENALRRARQAGAAPDEVVVLSVQVGRCEEGTEPDASIISMIAILKRLVRLELRAGRERLREAQVESRRGRRLDLTGPPQPLAVLS